MRNYNWKRFWCPRGGQINLSDGGFLYDPDSEYGYSIKQDVLPFEKIVHKPCLILLGEPGIGKSTEIEKAKKITKETLNLSDEQILSVNLNQYSDETRLIKDIFETISSAEFKKNNTPFVLFLDSLDECKLRIDTLFQILFTKFETYYYENLFLRIACRTAEWSNYFEQKLEEIWGEKNIFIYKLSPLRKKDVVVALKHNAINSIHFLEEIYKKDVQPLAMKPITLSFLITIFSKAQCLPNTRKELYEKGIRYLIEEQPNSSRKDSKMIDNFSLSQKIYTAERIAAFMIFGNRSSVLINTNCDQVEHGDILLEEIIGGNEQSEFEVAEIDQQLVKCVISTGLFTLRDKDRMGWAHQTYAEFLAASYIYRNRLDEEQIFDLILDTSFEERKIIPQLNETVGWLVSFIPDLFKKLMDYDPEVLLKSDVTLQEDFSKKKLVANLLRLFEEQKVFDLNYTFKSYYHKLDHPNLADQLKPFIVDKTKDWHVRYEAVDIAEKCNILVLQDELSKIFADKNDSYHMRINTGWALNRIADVEHKNMMKNVLFGDLSDDEDDEIKGICLMVLWPDFINARELFSFLEMPKNSSLFGSYVSFIYNDSIKNLAVKDLPYALEWVARQGARHSSDMYHFNDFIDSIMYMSWQNLEEPFILECFTKAVKQLSQNYDEIIIKKYREEFFHELDTYDSKRRILIQSIFNLLTDPIKGIDQFYGASRNIILPKDFQWVIEQADIETDENKIRAWLILSRMVFDINQELGRDVLISISKRKQIVYNEYEYCLKPIDLDSDEAKKIKERYYKHYKPNRFDEERALFKVKWEEKVVQLILDMQSGDDDAYWRLHYELCIDPEQKRHFSEHQSDLTILPGWKYLSNENQQLVVDFSKKYILKIDPQNGHWLGNDIWHRRSIPGYKAIRLLTKYDIRFIEDIETKVWKKWAATIVKYPIFSETERDKYHEKILEYVYQKAPDEILEALKILLDKECKKNDFIFITQKFDKIWDEKISKIVFDKIKDEELKPNSFSCLFEELLKHNYYPVEQYFITSIQESIPTEGDYIQKVILGCKQLIIHRTKIYWDVIWRLIKDRPNDLGQSIIINISDHGVDQKKILNSLSEIEIAELFIWIVKNFPSPEKKVRKGIHPVTVNEEVDYFKNNVISNLESRGTTDAIKAIGYIKLQLPGYEWLNRILYEAKIIARVKTWIPPKPSDIRKLISNKNLRYIKNEYDLMKVVVESLKKLEIEMHGETPTVTSLWNSKPATIMPKEEVELSNFIKTHLNRDLKNIIVNREVEIRGRRGNVPGEEPDILVQTFRYDAQNHPIEKMTLIIETKCCWHTDFLTAMQTQLLNRYLKNNQCMNGLYISGWYLCDSWDKSDYRYDKTSELDMSYDDVRKFLEKQAKSLSLDGMIINSFVLDCMIK